ncbi:unnamed protein product [Strongylus vulgaris]|uniref:Uncharacterized protein n=1 Tax=Strongylus vulgaris TaxID=40348 RepID=A0A3P7IR98_STRVU|nr:unnamed protein product [Strongylus vulgaris]
MITATFLLLPVVVSQSIKNISFGFPSAWDGDKYRELYCPSKNIPKFLDGFFLCQLSASYGDIDAPPGKRLNHMIDAIGAIGSFHISNGQVVFSSQYYPSQPYKIWEFYDRNMTKSGVPWAGWSDYNLTSMSKWEQGIFTISSKGVRRVVGMYDYGVWDPKACGRNDEYIGDKTLLPGYIHSITSTETYVVIPITSLLINPCKFKEPPPTNARDSIQKGGLWGMDFYDMVPLSTARVLRFTLDPKQQRVMYNYLLPQETIAAEFPQVNHKYDQKPYQWAYIVEHPFASSNRIIKVNVDEPAGTRNREYRAEPNIVLHEPWFVAKPDAVKEDDGVLLIRALDVHENKGGFRNTNIKLIFLGEIKDDPKKKSTVHLQCFSAWYYTKSYEGYLTLIFGFTKWMAPLANGYAERFRLGKANEAFQAANAPSVTPILRAQRSIGYDRDPVRTHLPSS